MADSCKDQLDITRESIKMTLSCGSNSVVECDLAKVEVAGSNPVSRSKFFIRKDRQRIVGSERRGTQVVKGEVCKTFMRRFESAPRLQ